MNDEQTIAYLRGVILVLPEVAETIEHIAGIKLDAPNQLD